MGTFFRFFVAIPLALIVTVILFLVVYNQLTPRPFLYTDPKDPESIFLELPGHAPIILCVDCGGHIVLPEKSNTDNIWTAHDKAAKEAPSVETDSPEQVTVQPPDKFKRPKDKVTMGHYPPPYYPQTCIDKKASGIVIVQYDVTPEGRTTNIRILESADACFNASIQQSVERYILPPNLNEEGRPIWRRNVVKEFTFIMDE